MLVNHNTRERNVQLGWVLFVEIYVIVFYLTSV